MTLWEFVLLVLLLLGVQAGLGIVMERRSPMSTWAWLMVLILVPVIGVPLYVLLGRTKVKRQIMRGATATRQLSRIAMLLDCPPSLVGARVDLRDVEPQTARLVVGMGGTLLRGGNRVAVLQDGPETFEAMAGAIARAERYVHLELFIFHPGQIGERMRHLLAEAAGRGVEVRMLFDAFGSIRLARSYLEPVLARGGQQAFFAPVRFSRVRKRPDFRNHRKVMVVDGRVGFVGGLNVMDEYVAGTRPDTPWRDTHLQVEGPVVHDLERVLNESWFMTTNELLATSRHYETAARVGDSAVQVVTSGPEDDWPMTEKVFTSSIFAAKSSLNLTTPYLVPTDSVLSALATAALRGVEVRLLVPAHGDHTLVHWASRSYYPDLMEAGVRIFAFGPRMVHAKTMSVDHRFCLVGTANLDIRSFQLNYEVGAMVYDADVTAAVDRAFARDVAASRELDLDEFRRRPYLQRVRENTARLFSPLL